MDIPKLDSGGLKNALVKAGTAHAAIRKHVEAHAAAIAKQRAEAHDALHAMNVMQHKS